ncbi:surface-adhesin E family protein [Limnohabitans sp. T6-20]|uniref:surface-adhesin E family protein n=1 Tax=Limnohabitans sp. T6-20 TaxID=1100725 RepID=UPI000D394EBE|nr:surface-adhesin E family protein [Limnohabitans sp. T6-20]
MTLPGFSMRASVLSGLVGLALLGGLMPASALAWTRIGETPEVTLYVNRNSIEKEDNVRRVWEMQDLKTPDAEGVRSRRYLNEYDCNYKMHRIGQMTSFAGPKMSGQKIASVDDMGYWRKIPPNGVFVLTYIAVCIE